MVQLPAYVNQLEIGLTLFKSKAFHSFLIKSFYAAKLSQVTKSSLPQETRVPQSFTWCLFLYHLKDSIVCEQPNFPNLRSLMSLLTPHLSLTLPQTQRQWLHFLLWWFYGWKVLLYNLSTASCCTQFIPMSFWCNCLLRDVVWCGRSFGNMESFVLRYVKHSRVKPMLLLWSWPGTPFVDCDF